MDKGIVAGMTICSDNVKKWQKCHHTSGLTHLKNHYAILIARTANQKVISVSGRRKF